MTIDAYASRHAATHARVRPALISALLGVLAIADLSLPVRGGIAPGPQIVLAFVLFGLLFRHRESWQSLFVVFLAGIAAMGLAAWGGAWDRYLVTAQPAWGNTAAGWLIAAAVAGFTAACLRRRDGNARQRKLEAELAAITRRLDLLVLGDFDQRREPLL